MVGGRFRRGGTSTRVRGGGELRWVPVRSLPAGRAQLLVRGVRGLGGYREGWRRAGGGWGGLTFKLTLAGRPTVLSLSLRRQVHLRRIVGHRAVGFTS